MKENEVGDILGTWYNQYWKLRYRIEMDMERKGVSSYLLFLHVKWQSPALSAIYKNIKDLNLNE